MEEVEGDRKRKVEPEVENVQSKRFRKPRTTEEMVATGFKSLMSSQPNTRTVTFCRGLFEATIKWFPPKAVDLELRVTDVAGNAIASQVVTQLIDLMNAFSSSNQLYRTSFIRVVNYSSDEIRQELFDNLRDVAHPEGWVRMQSCRAVIFHRGKLTVHLEVRGVDMLSQPPRLLEADVWHGKMRVASNTSTVLQLKDAIDVLRDKGSKFLEEGSIHMLRYRYPNPQPLRNKVALPDTLEVMEIKPYNIQTATTFDEGTTEWMTLIKDMKLGCHTDCVCNSSGSLRFVAYVAFDSSVLM